MIYSRRNSSPGARRTRSVAIVLAATVAIIAAIQWLAPQFFPGIAASFARPFWRAGFAIESGILRPNEAILAEKEALGRELDALKLGVSGVAVAHLIAENTELKSLLGRIPTSTPRVLAAVLAKPPHAPYDELIIDLGRRDGVSDETAVYAPGGTPIGRVASVLSETSSVRLFSSPGSRYEVFIGSSLIPATAIGRGGGYYIAELPHGAAVFASDPVSGSAFEDGLFGEVVSVASDPASPFSQLLIAPPVNIFGLRWVLLDIEPQNE